MDLTDATWRKSTHSGSNDGACIEVASVWRKSSHSGSNGGDCVEVADLWRKSTHSGSNGGACIEVGNTDRAVAIRDSKDPAGPALAFAPRAWQAFADHLKSTT
jgi:hypothetical protein